MSDCTHDCSSCGKNCGERKENSNFSAKLNAFSNVKKTIAVASGKGGVGKSFVTTMLAVSAMRAGSKTGVLDADITGPSIAKSLGLEGSVIQTEKGIEPRITTSGIRAISLDMLLSDPSDPVIWRGPVIAGAVKQFWSDVHWGELDVMFVDMPPGTGDVPLTVFQSLPVDGVVIVSSPQELVGQIVSKAVKMAKMMNIPILGLVENMSYFTCPDCGKKFEPFGKSCLAQLAESFGIPNTLALPIDPAFAAAIDAGAAEHLEIPGADLFLQNILR